MSLVETNNWLDFKNFKEKFQKFPVEEFPNDVLKNVSKPEISVLIITYQHGPYIRNAIESVLNQDIDKPWEIIIGDDDSTDGTREICIEYALKYPKLIRLFFHNRGNNVEVLGKTCGIFQIVYNIFNLRGKFITICSGDDYWESNIKLKEQYRFLSKKKKYSMVYTPIKIRRKSSHGDYEIIKSDSKYPFPSSLMCINVFEKLPSEMMLTINEDDFLKAIYCQYGKSKLIYNAGFTILNHTGNNLWANNSSGKNEHIINTSTLLYKVFGNIDHRFKRNLANCIVKNNLKSKEDYKELIKKDKWLYIYSLFYELRTIFLSKNSLD